MTSRIQGMALPVAALVAGAAIGYALFSSKARYSFGGKVVVITGGSRGLGLVLARQLAAEGARLALIARDAEELSRAEKQLPCGDAGVFTAVCDVRNQTEVNTAVQSIVAKFGRIDVLINNAGIIQVGPFDTMTLDDFTNAMAVHFYGPLYCTLAALPFMRKAGGGRIVNIASIGGKVAVPHLLPYVASKFALVGLSEGLRNELRRENILVTTVCPGLMRTGSAPNALFKGQHRKEYAWFSITGSLPFLSIDAETAARRIVSACRYGDARLIIGIQARAAALVNELAPQCASRMLSVTNQLLPGAGPHGTDLRKGHESESIISPSWITGLANAAALKNNEAAAGA